MESAIRFESVKKSFDYSSDKPQTIVESMVSAVSRRKKADKKTLWAVNDVSFDVMPGESLGIVGRNGSGKSTILKLASGIIHPTSGQVLIRGRLSALLELGAGFHPDLTGRENIFLNGSILGMSKADIDRCYDAIVDFSELEEFINMPVKHYSSGMYMRLGFSVAVHVEPEILIIDEILAVGDQAFQAKCNDRIFELKKRGTTIILVSHNLYTIRSLCSHAIWLEHGLVKMTGDAEDVIDTYLESQQGWKVRRNDDGSGWDRWGSREIELTSVDLLDETGKAGDVFRLGRPMTIEMHYRANRPVEEPVFGLSFFRPDGTYLSGPDNHLSGLDLGEVSGDGVLRYCLPELPLSPATYYLTAAIYDKAGQNPYDHHEKAYRFRVVADNDNHYKGLVQLPSRWEWIAEREQ
ncbi:MAG: ABC transporter ATP-binding protein [Candidatus Promineifilaceae bacterium]